MGKLIKDPPIKDIRRWPAIMLAVSRKVSAMGRIKLLKISTKIMNLIRKVGVPVGIRWHKKSFIEKYIINKITPIHSM